MIPVLSREESRAFDAQAIEADVPSIILMENAGRGATDVLVREMSARGLQGRVLVLCGAGNNGGDGWVVARHLLTRGHDVHVIAWGGRDGKATSDATIHQAAFVGLGGVVSPTSELDDALASCEVIVDALFGTGLDRPIEGRSAEVIAKMNQRGAFTFALDLPSGLCADTGRALGSCVRADATATFAFYKRGLLTQIGRACAGKVTVVDIGVPPRPAVVPNVHASTQSDVQGVLMRRPVGSHKYSAGHVAILGGRLGTLGAALLASHSAMRAGAGAATILTWPDSAAAAAARVTEVMTAPILGDTAEQRSSFVISQLLKKRAAVIGPGFGTDDLARKVVEQAVTHSVCPFVLDADGLSAFAGRASALAVAGGRAVLTPHEGEMARLLGIESSEIAADRYTFARAVAAETKCVVLLKGPYTLIADPEGDIVVNQTGGPALATAGAGDVLAGIIGALLCTLSPFEAAWVGAYLHGAAADEWSKENGDRGLLSHEVADRVPRVLSNTLCVGTDAGRGERSQKA